MDDDVSGRISFLWENLLLNPHQKPPYPREDEVLAEAIALVKAQVNLEAFWSTSRDEVKRILEKDQALIQTQKIAAQQYNNVVDSYRAYQDSKTRVFTLLANVRLLQASDVATTIDNILGSLMGLGHFARVEHTNVSNSDPSLDTEHLSRFYAAIKRYDEYLSSQMTDTATPSSPIQGKYGVINLRESFPFQRYVMKVISLCAETFQDLTPSITSAVQVRFILIYLSCPYFSEELEYSGLLEVCRCVTRMSGEGKQILKSWFTACPLSDLEKHTAAIREMMTIRISEHLGPVGRPDTMSFKDMVSLESMAAPYIRHGLNLLQILYDANCQRRRIALEEEMSVQFYKDRQKGIDLHPDTLKPLRLNYLDISEFYNDGINQKISMVYEDFKEWHRQSDHYTFGILEHPFVLDTAGKAQLLAFDSRMRQRIETARPRGIHGPLYLEIRRDHLVEDALNHLNSIHGGASRANASRLKNPLRVRFKNEEGIDQGGVAKEFFQLLVQQLFNVEYGMFIYHEDTRYFSFKPDSLEAMVQFELIGMIFGLALYNGIILDVHFPPVVYKKLLSGNTSVVPPPEGPVAKAWNAFRLNDNPENAARPSVAVPPEKPSGHTDAGPSVATAAPAETQPATSSTEPQATSAGAPAPTAAVPPAAPTLPQLSTAGLLPTSPWIALLNSAMEGPERILRWRLSPGLQLSEIEMVQKMAYTLPPYQPCLEDLEDFEPQIVANLRRLLAMPEEMVEDLGLTWSITTERFGEMVEIPLTWPTGKEGQTYGGSECSVTAENREAYVRAVLQYRLVDCAKEQFNAFYMGFHRCCGGPVLELFDPMELSLVICGSQEDLDFTELERGTIYEGFTPQTPVVRHFWEIANAYSQEDKRKLLFFITGSDRTPVSGLASLQLVIAKGGGDKNRLPTARTCFNYLLLPEFDSKEELEKSLRIALDNRHGFYLE